ncbi:MAG: hypothetical protein IJG97_01720 [Bacilli bacterium]|nr:hypothetical protein [Bacilli bacterium]
MKNKVLKILMIIVLVTVCTACNGSITREIRHAGFSISKKFICDKFYPQDKDDTSYLRIRYFTENHLIDQNGKIYEISLQQSYQSGENCKEADTAITVKTIFDDKIIKGTDDKYYYLIGQNNVSSYSEIPKTDNSYDIYNLLLKDVDTIKVVTADSSAGEYYLLKTDGNVYSYVITKKDYNSAPVVTSVSTVYNKNDFDSKIIDFNYAGNSLATFIKTENKVYRMRITNSSECKKYADIECKYKMEEDSLFEEYKDRIIVYNGSSLITDYKQVFNVAS